MGLLANSYGDTGEIAALTPRYTDAKVFDVATKPTIATVESLVDQVSAILNAVLAHAGFTIPVSQADAKLMLDMFVNEEVAALVEGVNGAGRFGPTSKRPGKQGRFALILGDVEDFVERNAIGIERLGASMDFSLTDSIAFRETDNSGDDTYPLFQREAFGGPFTPDWDPN